MVIPIYKPKSWTSFDVVNKIRHITHIKRVGHAGTLDPMAEGVLVVAIGRESTKTLGQLMLGQKVYDAEITFGAVSTTDDAEGILTSTQINQPGFTQTQLSMVLEEFIGTIQQIPPVYSAIKMGGKPSYKLARSGKELPMAPRSVTIDAIRLIRYDWPVLTIQVSCQKGVYIRSLARDIGKKLAVGGYLSKLIRTQVGPYSLRDCQSLDDFEKKYGEFKNSTVPTAGL